jgi:cytochrome c
MNPKGVCAGSVFTRDCGPNRTTGAMTLAVMLAVGYPAAMAIAFLLAVEYPAHSFAPGDAAHGATIYHECMICHSLDKNGIGPRHQGVFGRKAGSVPDYNYTAALKGSNIVWNEATLDQWLTNPQALVPGTKMMFSVDNARDRADVIAFLKEKAASDPSGATVGAK